MDEKSVFYEYFKIGDADPNTFKRLTVCPLQSPSCVSSRNFRALHHINFKLISDEKQKTRFDVWACREVDKPQ